MTALAPYLKAFTGALIAGLASLQQALDDGAVSAQEWTGVAIATLSGLALVWAIPNKDPQGEHQDESTQPPAYQPQILGKAFTGGTFSKAEEDARDERGATELVYALVVVLLVVLILSVVGVF